MSKSLAALAKVSMQLSRRRARIDDFFFDHDRLRTGRITPDHFRRVLSLNKVNITRDEMLSLMEICTEKCSNEAKLQGKDHGGHNFQRSVNYVKFLSLLRQMETEQSFDRACTSVEMKPHSTDSCTQRLARGYFCDSTEDKLKLDSVMQHLRHIVFVQNVNIKPYFKDFDKLHNGRITCTQFARAVSSVMRNSVQLDSRVLSLLTDIYVDSDGQVNYERFIADIRCVDNNPGRTASQSDVAKIPNGTYVATSSCDCPGRTAKHLIEILRYQFACYRLRCEDFFYDYDKMRSGIVSASQFESALGRLAFVQFKLTQSDMYTLINEYQVKDDQVCSLFRSSNDNDDDDINAVMSAIRVNYVHFLHDLSTTTGEHDRQRMSDCRHQVSAGSTVSGRAVNYFERAHNPGIFLTTLDDQCAADAAVARVRRFVSSTRAHFSPVLRDFDRAHKSIYEHRTCTQSRFVRVLAMLPMELTQKEIQHIIRKYTVPRFDGAPSDEVNYYQFVLDVEASTQMQSSDKTSDEALPLHPEEYMHHDKKMSCETSQHNSSVLKAVNALCTPNHGLCHPSSDARICGENNSRVYRATALDEILADIAEQAAQRELRVGEYFIDFDPLRSGVVPWSKFVTALGLAGVQIGGGDEALRALHDEYLSLPSSNDSSLFAPIHSTDRIDIRRFIADVASLLSDSSSWEESKQSSAGALDGSNSPFKAKSVPKASTEPDAENSQSTRCSMLCDYITHAHPANSNNNNDNNKSNHVCSDELATLIDRLRHEIRIHSALLTPFFAEFDHHNHGTITQMQFRQALTRHCFVLTEREIQLLFARYSSSANKLTRLTARSNDSKKIDTDLTHTHGSGDVNYRCFVRDVGCGEEGRGEQQQHAQQQEQMHGGTIVNPSSDSFPAVDTTSEQAARRVSLLQQTMYDICRFMQERRPRMSEFFPDGDELRHHRVSGARFRHCLSVLGLNFLSEQQLDALEHEFSVPPTASSSDSLGSERMVDYPRFLRTLRELMIEGEGLRAVTRSRNGLSMHDGNFSDVMPDANACRGGEALHVDGVAAQSERARVSRDRLNTVIQKVRKLLATRRTISLPSFREYDRARKGVIKQGQFFTCLLSLGLQLSPNEVDTLHAAYSLDGGEILYTRFTREVDDPTFVRVS